MTEAVGEVEPRLFFIYNFTGGAVSPAYAALIVFAISFAIAATGGLLYHGLYTMSSYSSSYSRRNLAGGRHRRLDLPNNSKQHRREDDDSETTRFLHSSIAKYS